jgi:hypothetical protein
MTAKIEYVSGFIKCRLLGIDESSGEDEVVEGRHVRFRCSEIVVYAASGPGTVEVELRSYDDVFQVMGTMEQMDACMTKDRLFAHEGGS